MLPCVVQIDLTKSAAVLNRNFLFVLFRKMVVEKERPMLLDEHEEIVKAIEDRDEILAVQLLMEHLDKDLEFGLYYLG
ncbi:FCD domain-containing protein [Macrococcoides canis]|uniref:FCD domain-containing protein n=1 Tax=Macrococcoides canis TaxID=1855823 RepID=UPI001F21331A|nr:FCD domain-containing protein [Macrococcus canis]